MKIVINICHGIFGLSPKAREILAKEKNIPAITSHEEESLCRNDPSLVSIVERLGKEADGTFAELKVVVVPDDVQWVIKEYDGKEWVAEKHRTWS